MAIGKQLQMYNGDITTYHRVSFIDINCVTLVYTATLESFLNRQQREQLPNSIHRKNYQGTASSLATMHADVYSGIMALPEWSGASLV